MFLPAFCPTDLYRAARPRMSLNGSTARTPADQSECDAGELCRTSPDEPHPAENRKDQRFEPIPGRHPWRPAMTTQGELQVATLACPEGGTGAAGRGQILARCRVGDLAAGPHWNTQCGHNRLRNHEKRPSRRPPAARATRATTATAPSPVGRPDRPGNTDCCPSAARGGRIRTGRSRRGPLTWGGAEGI